MNSNELSIIILTWNSQDYIGKCIESIYKFIKDIPFEVIVVDNGSKDRTVEVLKNFQEGKSNFKCIFLDKNYGTTYPRNLAIKESKGEYLLLLDSDAQIAEDSISMLLETLDKKKFKNVGVMAPRLVYPDCSIQYSCKKFPTLQLKILKFLGKRFEKIALRSELYDSRVYSPDFHEIIEVDYCISACWLLRREALDEVGLFDERIFYAPEDVDLCVRMWLKGWKIIYNPNAVVVHYAQRISYKNWKMSIEHARGLIYYFAKHGYLFSRNRVYKRIMNFK